MKFTFQLATSVLIPILITSPVQAEPQSSDVTAVSQIHISIVDREQPSVAVASTSAKGFTVLVADASGAPLSDCAVVFRLPDEGASGSFSDNTHSAIVYTSANGLAHVSDIKWNNTPGSVPIKVTATKGEARAGMLLSETLTAKPEIAAPASATPGSGASSIEKPSASAVPATQAPTVSRVQPGTPAAAETAAPPRPATALDAPHSVSAPPPAVSVTSGKSMDSGYHASHKKWIIIAAIVVAAAGAGVALGSKGKSNSSSSTSTAGVSVGTPTVSVGQP